MSDYNAWYTAGLGGGSTLDRPRRCRELGSSTGPPALERGRAQGV